MLASAEVQPLGRVDLQLVGDNKNRYRGGKN